MNISTRNRIKELQDIARTARYNAGLTEKRLATAKRKNNVEKVEWEDMVLGAWIDTYHIAKEDILTYGGV